jgi:hypothetical protein
MALKYVRESGMQTVSAGINFHLLERYPQLQFLLHYSPFVPYHLSGSPLNAFNAKGESLHCPNIALEVERFVGKLNLDGVDIIYIFGIGLGYHYRALKDWLKEKRDRRLIFLEDDLAVIQALVQNEHAESLLSDPQVIVHFLASLQKTDALLDEVVAAYPCDRIEVVAIESYQKRKKRRLQKIRMKLLRKSAVAQAILTESLYSHQMLINLLRNIKRWHGSFDAVGLKGKFKGIPALICGAGPSLQASIPLLKTLEDRALIIAGGSAIAALSNQGIQPHLGIALDPNPEEFDRLKIASAFETPLLYATRLQPDVFNAINAERGYLISDTGGPCERYFEKALEIEGSPIGPELGPEALSVTTLAIALASEMGCNPILLDGIDLSYTGMQRYADGILASSQMQIDQMRKKKKALERLLKRKDIHGHYVHTLVKWVMESDCIASYAKAHPKTRFINVCKGGIGFLGIPNVPLAEAVDKELQLTLDLRSLVHAEIQQLKMPLLEEKIEHQMRSVGESLLRLRVIAEEMIEELERVHSLPFLSSLSLSTGRMTILEIDFQEEKAFECLFINLGPSLDKLLSRAFFTAPESSEEEKRRLLIESKIAKWKQWKAMIDSEIAIFQEHGNL